MPNVASAIRSRLLSPNATCAPGSHETSQLASSKLPANTRFDIAPHPIPGTTGGPASTPPPVPPAPAPPAAPADPDPDVVTAPPPPNAPPLPCELLPCRSPPPAVTDIATDAPAEPPDGPCVAAGSRSVP